MLDGAGVKEVAELARAAQDGKDRIVDINVGEVTHVMSTTPLHHIAPKPEAEPESLKVSSLGALATYLEANRDQLTTANLVLLVVSPTVVRLCGPIVGEKKQRFCYAEATAVNLVDGWVDRPHQQEDFIIALQSRFQDLRDRGEVLEVVSKLTQQQTLEATDDGVGQHATVQAGVHLARQLKVPNPVTLAPFRTFREVEQPESLFVLRIKPGPSAGLFEADGGAWKIQAVDRIATWLEAETKEIPVLR